MTRDQKKALIEAAKSIVRVGILFGISWLVGETLKQVGVVPEFLRVKVWLFEYLIPARSLFTTGLTSLGIVVDRYLHVYGKEKAPKVEKGQSFGLIRI